MSACRGVACVGGGSRETHGMSATLRCALRCGPGARDRVCAANHGPASRGAHTDTRRPLAHPTTPHPSPPLSIPPHPSPPIPTPLHPTSPRPAPPRSTQLQRVVARPLALCAWRSSMDSDTSQRSQRDRWEQRLHALAKQPSAHHAAQRPTRCTDPPTVRRLPAYVRDCCPSMRSGPSPSYG
jgi:hypothetical protein